jgi:hypothetical protein
MLTSTSSMQRSRAPCGQTVDAEHHQEREEDHQVADVWYYACGCRTVVHEYDDGSIQHKVIHHNGDVLEDELLAEHHP